MNRRGARPVLCWAFGLVLFTMVACRDSGLDPSHLAALLAESDAAAVIRVEETKVLENIGGENGYFVNAVYGEVLRVFKGDLRPGEKMLYVNFIESGPRFPMPGDRIVFLNVRQDSTDAEKEWKALENSDFEYTRALARAIEKMKK